MFFCFLPFSPLGDAEITAEEEREEEEEEEETAAAEAGGSAKAKS